MDDDGTATLGDFIDRDQFPKWATYTTYMSRNGKLNNIFIFDLLLLNSFYFYALIIKLGTWGDHITLLAAAEVYGVNVS